MYLIKGVVLFKDAPIETVICLRCYAVALLKGRILIAPVFKGGVIMSSVIILFKK